MHRFIGRERHADRESYVFVKTRKNGLIQLLQKVNDHQMKDHRMKSSDVRLIDITDLNVTDAFEKNVEASKRTLAKIRNDRNS